MAAQNNAAPAIIKKKKVVIAGGHHGGAWKVAYADFVTAMMAFFMLMWLLNATTEKQRKGLADYFSPTIPMNRVSGGGEGALGGDSVFSEETLAHSGNGGTRERTTAQRQMRGDSGMTVSEIVQAERGREDAAFKALESKLLGRSGESNTMDEVRRHIVTRVTDEGLIVEIFDLPGSPLFDPGTATPRPIARALAAMMAEVFALVTNRVAINGHVRHYPIVMIDNPAWALSAARAGAMRNLVERDGLDRARMQRVSGYADRKAAVQNPDSIRNNRIEVILLRPGKS